MGYGISGLDPYFSATKIAWILDAIPGARSRAERGELAAGTIDSWIVWHLTGGASHVTDVTNASRTLLFNIHAKEWDEELLRVFKVPREILPRVLPTAAEFGTTSKDVLGGSVPICALVGDQQSALIGQTCFSAGMAKCTFGTGSFLVLSTGITPVKSQNRLLTTIAYEMGGETVYALEGSSLVAGATVQWLRDGLHLITAAAESEQHAQAAQEDLGGVYLVPAFAGLGAPYWDADARAAIVGITRGTGVADIVAAGLMSVAYQTRDLVEAMRADGASPLTSLRVDGGMVVNNWLMQALADILGIAVERPKMNETTALGAAYVAGLYTGFYGSKEMLAGRWEAEARFEPVMGEEKRRGLYEGWIEAVRRVRSVRS